ncbi:hypothetical protein Pint_22666 [Pistacia integerrima]|uniref:Uncharacterized protein n=1 Tax=Pistacia integerrima TaxID=434235 RepID=A0ACC0YNN2_9ROSI|nr:hypothetical protein Pint_22666 [Pistacia integerrima]
MSGRATNEHVVLYKLFDMDAGWERQLFHKKLDMSWLLFARENENSCHCIWHEIWVYSVSLCCFMKMRLKGELPCEPSSVDIAISISSSLEFPGDQFFGEISRVLKPGGTILLYKNFNSDKGHADKAISAIERKLMLAGFLEACRLELKSDVATEDVHFFRVKGKKPSWKLGSSFALKKAPKSLLKVQLDDDCDVIDEDSLLTEEDLKKPKLSPVGDCEVGSTRKACKNCTCGRAEAEEKVLKLGLTMNQLNNPQSARGSCGLGDAFRCSTCPYKGLPPFKLGEKVWKILKCSVFSCLFNENLNCNEMGVDILMQVLLSNNFLAADILI